MQRSSCAQASERLPHSSFILHPSSFRQGVTLVELLITITIVSILSAAFLGTSNLAIESSRKARTKSTIGKLHGLLMEKWSEYATRRVDIDPDVLQVVNDNIAREYGDPAIARRFRGQALAELRLLALRELMKLEIPDRWSDCIGDTVANVPPTSGRLDFETDRRRPALLQDRPAITKAYLRRYTSLQADPKDIVTNQGAECLYMVIMLSTADGEARTMFSEQDIGDTDEDGAPEFLDGWGQPISMIRWPAGFAYAGRSEILAADADVDHDPFDVFRRDHPLPASEIVTPAVYSGQNRRMRRILNQAMAIRSRNRLDPPISGYRLVPLIYSSGPDAESGLATFDNAEITDPYLDYSQSNPGLNTQIPSLGGILLDGEDSYLDNIHNHLQDNK